MKCKLCGSVEANYVVPPSKTKKAICECEIPATWHKIVEIILDFENVHPNILYAIARDRGHIKRLVKHETNKVL